MIKNVNFEVATLRTWTKYRGQHLLSPEGRWGPRWLARLIFRIAKNLGMVSHNRSSTDALNVVRFDVMGKTVKEMIVNACEPYLSKGYGIDDLLCVMGPESFAGLATMLTHEHFLMLTVPYYRNHRATVFNIPVCVSPYVDGIVVLRRSHFR